MWISLYQSPGCRQVTASFVIEEQQRFKTLHSSESCVYRLGLIRFLGEVLGGGAIWLSRRFQPRSILGIILLGSARVSVCHFF